MGQSSHVSVAAQLQTLSNDASRPAIEREVASTGAVQVSLRAAAPTNSIVYFASTPGGLAYDSAALGGGIFTSALIKGLTSPQLFGSKGPVTTSDMASYLSQQVALLSNKYVGTTSNAYIEGNTGEDTPVLVPEAGQRVFAFVVGVGHYQRRDLPAIEYSISDADKVASLFRSSGATVSLLHDPTRASFEEELNTLLSQLHSNDKLLFYYSGHGLMLDGENLLLMTDSVADNPSSLEASAVSATSIKRAVDRAGPSSSIWFLDVCRDSPFSSR